MKSILFLLLVFPNLLYAQVTLTKEDVFIYSLKRTMDPTNPAVGENEYLSYCRNFDLSNFNRVQRNEFERHEYRTRMISKIKTKILNLSYKKIFITPASYTDLRDYDFNEGSFELRIGPGMPIFNFDSYSMSANYFNFDRDFPTLKIKMTPTNAKKFLDAKKYPDGKTNRRVYVVAKFNFMDMDLMKGESSLGKKASYFFNVFIQQIDIFNDKGLTQKIATFYPLTNSINKATGINSSLNNNNIFDFYDANWNSLGAKPGLTFEQAVQIAQQQNVIFSKAEYRGGKLNNPVLYYRSDGKFYASINFANNTTVWTNRNGPSIYYHTNGKESYFANFKMGKFIDYEAGWYESGKLKFVQGYDDWGNKAGPHIEYNENGERTVQERWYGGNLLENESGRYYNSEFTDSFITNRGFKLPDTGNIIYRPAKK